jgi:hypothetical protein
VQTARRDVMADHRDGIERVADYPAHGSLIDAEFGKPAPVINLGEQHEADFADQTIDLLRKLCLGDRFFGQRHDFTEECRARQSAEPDEHVIVSAAGMDHNSHAIEGTAARNSLNHDKTMLATSCGFSTAEK